MKIATWNVNSLRVRLPHLLDWLASERPDVVGLQETKLSDPDFPGEAIAAAGYQAVFSGEKTYNGVALLARGPAEAVVTGIPGLGDDQRRVIAASYGDLRVIDLYVPNGQAVGSEKYDYKLRWLGALTGWLRREAAEHPRLVVVGDYNIAPDDRDVHDPKVWEEAIMCSSPERAAFHALLDLGLCDCFRRLEPEGGHFSWWDYRAGAFRRGHGLRIDHLLASAGLCERLRACRIDRDMRARERPSDHAPVIAEFDL